MTGAVAAPARRYLNAKAHGRFSQIPEWLETSARLSPWAKLIYARLIRYASDKDGRGWIAYPSKRELCEAIGLVNAIGEPMERQLYDFVSELESFGLIESVRAGLGRSNYYRFPVHPLMYGEGDDATTERPPEPVEAPPYTGPDRSSAADSDRRTGAGLDRRLVTDQDRRTAAGQIGERVPVLIGERSPIPKENRTREQNQRTEPSSSHAGGRAPEAQSARGGWEKHPLAGEARKVMAFITWYTRGPELKHPGNILDRLAEGETVYDLMLVFWWFCSFADLRNQNATVPFSESNFGKLFDQAQTEQKRGRDDGWKAALDRGVKREEVDGWLREVMRITEDGRLLDLLHFAQHGTPRPDRKAVAS